MIPGFNPAQIKSQLKKSDSPSNLQGSPKVSTQLPAKQPIKQPLKKTGTDALFEWCQKCTIGYDGVEVKNFTTSWKDGLAFCAIIHHFRPSSINFKQLKKENDLENLQLAFNTAEKLGVIKLLDAEDIVKMSIPDKVSIITYLSEMYKIFGIR